MGLKIFGGGLMNKKAQLSIILIVGFVLVLGVGLFLVLKNKSKSDSLDEINQEIIQQETGTKSIKGYVESCLNDIVVPVIYEVASQSGYLYVPPGYLDTGYSRVSYLFKDDKAIMPSEFAIKENIQDFVNLALPRCLSNFEAFNGMDIQFTSQEVDVVLGEEDVFVGVNLPIVSQTDKISVSVESFSVKVPIRLKYVLDVTEDILFDLEKDPLWLDFTALSDYDLDVSIQPYNRSVLIFSITDFDSSYVDEPFVFLFAAQFNVHEKPEMNIEDEFYLYDNELFSYTVNILNNQIVTFEDDTPMFDISSDGVIEFTPKVTGEFDVNIIATNEVGLITEKGVKFIIR